MRHRRDTAYGDFGESSVPLEKSRGYASLKSLVREIVFESLGRVEGDDGEFNDTVLKEIVHMAVGPMLRKVILSALGVEEDWGKVRLSSNSIITSALQGKLREHAKTIVDEHVAKDGLPKLEGDHELKKLISGIDHELRSALREELRTRIKKIAQERVETIPREVLLPLVDEVMMESYPALRRLEALRRLDGERKEPGG